jgi:hypothetical protein
VRAAALLALLQLGCGGSKPAPGDAGTTGGRGGSGGAGGTGGTGGTAGTGGSGGGTAGTGGSGGSVDSGVADSGGPFGSRDSGGADVPTDANADALLGPDGPDPRAGGTLLRTYVYHQLTALSPGVQAQGRWHSVISASGTGIAFVQATFNPSKIFYINADGSGLLEVDSYQPHCNCTAQVDISADGTGIVSGTPAQLRYVRSDGSNGKTLIETDGEISDFRLSGDGRKVFFLLRRDDADRTSRARLPRGVWAIGVDGTGLTQVVDTADLASLYQVGEENVFPFNGCGISLGVSNDAGRLVFAANIGGSGNKVLAAAGDGSGLREIAGAGGSHLLVGKVAISGDGSKLLYTLTAADNFYDLVVSGFDGGGKRTLASTRQIGFSSGGACGDPGLLTTQGNKAYLADVGLLIDTDGSGMISMTLPSAVGGPTLLSGRQYGGWMNGDGTRFAFLGQDGDGRAQIVSLQVGAPELGAAPSIREAIVTPPKLQKGTGAGAALISARVTAPGTLHGVSTVFARNGLRDPELFAPQTLVDDGTQGDGVAGDLVYSSDQGSAAAGAATGPRTLRIHVESTSEGRRHATVLELADIEVE